jgi:hypothetical protein
MPPKSTKKQPVKRKYTKRAKDIKKPEADFEQVIDEFKAAAPKTELDEIEFLDAVVTGVEQLTNEQKSRFINYIYSRYCKFITLSKLTL